MKKFTSKLMSFVASTAIALSLTGFLSIDSNASGDCGYRLSGVAHVQDQGDTAGTFDASTGILTLGTRGLGRRVEAISISLDEAPEGLDGTIYYNVHVQDYGWMDAVENGETAGTSGQSKRLESICIWLSGELDEYYSVEYQVHIQDYGDAQGFVKDAAIAGTTGEAKRLEEVQIRLVKRDSSNADMSVNYRVHRQDYGWESTWAKDGAESGTTGQGKRLEGIEIFLTGTQYSGGVAYKTHIQDYGWEREYSYNGDMSGTQGEAKRLEAIQIILYGDVADHYDIYYRVHSQDYGWLGWACNGELAGTAGKALRLEAIQIVLVEKGGAAPGSTDKSFVSETDIPLDSLGFDNDYLYFLTVLSAEKYDGKVFVGTNSIYLGSSIIVNKPTIEVFYSADTDFTSEELSAPISTYASDLDEGMLICLVYINDELTLCDNSGSINNEIQDINIPAGFYRFVVTESDGTEYQATCCVL